MHISLINGLETSLDISHRGLAYGDGLFETCLVENGAIQFLNEHLDRLALGAQVLKLAISDAQLHSLRQQLISLTLPVKEPHVLKIMLLRSAPGRGYDFNPVEQNTDSVILLNPYQKPAWSQGATLVASRIPVTENSYLAGIKHLNRLDSVLSRQYARTNNAHDALMLTQQGRVIETTMANVFLKVQGQWFTPVLDTAGVNGIIRQKILSAFSSQIIEQDIDQATLTQVESAFITNSLIGIIPIIELNHRALELCPSMTHFTDFLRQLRD